MATTTQIGHDPAIEAFGTWARQHVALGDRHTAGYERSLHHDHPRGWVYAWKMHGEAASLGHADDGRADALVDRLDNRHSPQRLVHRGEIERLCPEQHVEVA